MASSRRKPTDGIWQPVAGNRIIMPHQSLSGALTTQSKRNLVHIAPCTGRQVARDGDGHGAISTHGGGIELNPTVKFQRIGRGLAARCGGQGHAIGDSGVVRCRALASWRSARIRQAQVR